MSASKDVVPHEVTPARLTIARKGAMLGLPRRQIAAMMGIDQATLARFYGEHMDDAAGQANQAVGAALLKMASSGKDPSASIFWAKARMRWSDKDGADQEAPAPVINVINFNTGVQPMEVRDVIEAVGSPSPGPAAETGDGGGAQGQSLVPANRGGFSRVTVPGGGPAPDPDQPPGRGTHEGVL